MSQPPASREPATIAEVLRGGEPMGDLRRFAIEDLTPDEEDEFFAILEEIFLVGSFRPPYAIGINRCRV